MTEVPRRPPRHCAWRFLRAVLRWMLLLLVIPAGLLATAEGLLRLAGYGESRVPFERRVLEGRPYHVFNEAFLGQFLKTPILMENFAVPAEKAPNAFRILVIGGSAAQGWPMPRFAFSNVLELQLRAAYPGVDFEMLNCAVAGFNMNALRPVVEAAHVLDYDLLLVYSGNNEFTGIPYGIDVFNQTGSIPSATTIRWLITMRNWRLFQWMERAAMRRQPGDSTPQNASEEEQRANTRQINANFEANLRAVAKAAARAGATPVLCTVAVNLREWPPFGRSPFLATVGGIETAWRNAVDAGNESLAQQDWDAAAGHYETALGIHDNSADIHFKRARCLLAMEQHAAARAHFLRAAELDESPFARCRPSQNNIIRYVAESEAANGVTLVDFAKNLDKQSHAGAAGMEFFYDSCHFTFDGTCAAAMAILDGIRDALPDWVTQHAAKEDTALSRADLAACLGYDPAPAAEHFERLIARRDTNPPMTTPFLESALARLRAEQPATASDTEAMHVVARAMAVSGDSHLLLERAARLHMNANQPHEAVSYTARLIDSAPARKSNYLMHGEVLRLNGEPAASRAVLEKGIALFGNDFLLILNLIYAAMDAGQPEVALAWTERATCAFPDYAILWVQAYKLHAHAGRPEEADAAFTKAVQDPNTRGDAWTAKADYQRSTGDLQGAREAYLEAIAASGANPVPVKALFEVEQTLLGQDELLAIWAQRATNHPENQAIEHVYETARALAERPGAPAAPQ